MLKKLKNPVDFETVLASVVTGIVTGSEIGDVGTAGTPIPFLLESGTSGILVSIKAVKTDGDSSAPLLLAITQDGASEIEISAYDNCCSCDSGHRELRFSIPNPQPALSAVDSDDLIGLLVDIINRTDEILAHDNQNVFVIADLALAHILEIQAKEDKAIEGGIEVLRMLFGENATAEILASANL